MQRRKVACQPRFSVLGSNARAVSFYGANPGSAFAWRSTGQQMQATGSKPVVQWAGFNVHEVKFLRAQSPRTKMPEIPNARVNSPLQIATDRTLGRINISLGLIVLALVIALCFAARMLCMTVIVASFLAILLDPLVVRLERLYIPLPLAAALVVVCGMILMGVVAYVAYEKANNFAIQLPVYSERVREALQPVLMKFEILQQNAESIAPTPGNGVPEIKVREVMNWPSVLVRGVGSITSGLVMTAVVPFLCFFLLIKKDELSARFATILESKINVSRFVNDLEGVVRGFVIGNLVVGTILAGTTAFVLTLLGVKNAITLSVVLAALNLIPFLGILVAAAVAVAALLVQFSTLGPFLVVLSTILILHVVSQNILVPRIIGSHVNVGPVAIIIGMLFWGWLWGWEGVLLAVPLTAIIKLIAETQSSLVHLAGFLAPGPCTRNSWFRIKGRPISNADLVGTRETL